MHGVVPQLVEVLGGLDCGGALSVHRRGKEQHVQVVLWVDREPLAKLRHLVGVPRPGVRAHPVGPAAHLVPGVRRHVVDVARAWYRQPEMLGAGLGLVGSGRRLRRVDVEVTRARVRDVDCQDLLELLVQTLRVRIVDVAIPATRLEQEQRIGVEGRDVEILRIGLVDPLHGVPVGLVLLLAHRRVVVLDVADRHCVDERLLLGCRVVVLETDCLLHSGPGMRRLVRPHRTVEIRPPGPRLPPVADRAVGVALPGLPERAGRVHLGERVHHLEPLVEILLHLGLG